MNESSTQPQTTAERVACIVDESDYAGEAAARASEELNIPFGEALALVMEEFERVN